jgi:hypothetical protein
MCLFWVVRSVDRANRFLALAGNPNADLGLSLACPQRQPPFRIGCRSSLGKNDLNSTALQLVAMLTRPCLKGFKEHDASLAGHQPRLDSKLRVKALVENQDDGRVQLELNLIRGVARIDWASVRECHPSCSSNHHS